jgi:hypothetical protein
MFSQFSFRLRQMKILQLNFFHQIIHKFLVKIWLSYHKFNVGRLTEWTLLGKLLKLIFYVKVYIAGDAQAKLNI